MKNIVLLFFLSVSIGFGQEVKLDALNEDYKNSLEVHTFFGNATLTAKNLFKVNVNVRGGGVTKRFTVKDNYSIGVGIESYFAESGAINENSQNLYLTNNIVQLPMSLRYDFKSDDKLSALVEVGIYGAYLYQSKLENEFDGTSEKSKDEGFNLGLTSFMGLKYRVNNILKISLGLRGQGDLFRLLDKKINYSVNNLYAFQIGANLKLK